jgi:hypothetical protein
VLARLLLAVSTAGFASSAALHLATFAAAAPVPGDRPVFALYAAAFLPLLGMIARLRRAGVPTRSWWRVRVYDWRALAARVPLPMRWLAAGMGAYVGMNFLLSLLLLGGASGLASGGRYYVTDGGATREVSRQEYEAVRRPLVRLLSGHLLLFYLVPLLYFRFVDAGGAVRGSPSSVPGRDGTPEEGRR